MEVDGGDDNEFKAIRGVDIVTAVKRLGEECWNSAGYGISDGQDAKRSRST